MICEWKQDQDGNWDTGCKNAFIFTDGGPWENGFNFCPYCGKRIGVKEELIP